MKVLVTGGAGFIGSYLSERLVDDGAEVTILDNLSRGSLGNLSRALNRVRFIRGDIRDAGSVSEAMNGVSVVFHLAAQSNVLRAAGNIRECFTSNVVGTFEVLRVAKDMRVKHIV